MTFNDQNLKELASQFNPKTAQKASTGYIHGMNIQNPEHLVKETDHLKFEVMGGVNIKQLDRLKVTLKLSRNPTLSPVHSFRNTLDLYNDNQITRYIRQAAERLELGTNEITNPVYEFINAIEAYRMDKRQQMLIPGQPKEIKITPAQKKKAKTLLNNKNLLNEISDLLKDCGLVNEETNGLLLFNIFLTRFFDKPLHAIVHGSSGSGKTNLLKTVIMTVPEEHRHVTTSLTENVLFYPPYKEFWSHKILMLEDLDGSLAALYAIREFASNGSITKFSTEMDQNTGEHRQKKLEANGPICIVGATTKENIYEDNSNRSFLLHIDESKAHQKAVMEYQNAEAAGLLNKSKKDEAQLLLQNLQRLLEKIRIVNPFQPELMLPDVVFKPLRTNQHYINLIKAVTFLHQAQREIQQDKNGRFIETTLNDIQWANKLCRDSLLSKSDLLTGSQRTFFETLKRHLLRQKKESFFTKDIRAKFKLHRQTLKRLLNALEGFYFISRIGSNPKMSFEYKVNVWDDYETIEKSINAMDDKLKDLREKYPKA